MGHLKNGPKGGRKKNEHRFALNMYDFYMNLSPGPGGLREWGTRAVGHPKNGHKGAGKKNGHSFPLNIDAFYMDFSHRGRGGYGSGGLGQWVTFKMGLRGPEKKMVIILPQIWHVLHWEFQ